MKANTTAVILESYALALTHRLSREPEADCYDPDEEPITQRNPAPGSGVFSIAVHR